jgi:transcriptional regulator with XRE-family HTH domain
MGNNIKRTTLGNNLRMLRKKLNITQEAIAEMLGVKRATYARYETDTTPPIKILTKLGEVLGVTADELLREDIEYATKMQVKASDLTLSNYNEYNNGNNEFYNGITDDEMAILIRLREADPEKREEIIKLLELE